MCTTPLYYFSNPYLQKGILNWREIIGIERITILLSMPIILHSYIE